MNPDIINDINRLVLVYKSNNDENILEQIQRKLIHLEYQSDILRYNLRIIENPKLKYTDEEFGDYNFKFAHFNALSKYHIIIPLLMFLLQNHATKKSAYETSLNFMQSIKEYLKEGDYAKLKTGSQRFITNTRFAADELRKYGLLRSDRRTFFNIWELSYFGLILACNIYADRHKLISAEAIREQTNESAEWFALNLLNDYGRVAESLENFNKMIEYIREEEEIISYGIKRMPSYFEKYQKLISAVIKDGKINNKKMSTMDFIEFMEKYNTDKSFSDFADGLILRKDIEVNIKDVYKILESNPT